MSFIRPVRILLIEDHIADIGLTREAFRFVKTPHQLDVVIDGFEAMQFLRQQGRHSEALRPDLILLDLCLPRKDGREVLREVKEDPVLRSIPVIIFTISDEDAGVRDAYDLGANCYFAKPVAFTAFRKIVELIEAHWFHAVLYPKDVE